VGPGWPLSFLTLPVRGKDQVAAFYRDLGLVPSERSPPGCAFFDLPGATLALVEVDVFAEECGLAPGPPGGVGFSWNVDHEAAVDELIARAVAAGGTVLRPAEATVWGGRRGWFADPEGHRWEAVWNPKRPPPPWTRRS
jgi:hypothetical protein